MSTNRVVQKEETLLSAKATTGFSTNPIDVRDAAVVILKLGTASSANLTVKVQGSVSDTAPDFSAAASVSNHWTYLGSIDYISGSVVAGGTGYVASGTDIFHTIQLNTEGIKWLSMHVSARSAGSVTVTATKFID